MSFYRVKFDVVMGCKMLLIYRNGKFIAKYEYVGDKWTMVYCQDMKYYFAVETEKNKALIQLGENKTQAEPNIDWEASYNTLKKMVERTLEPILATVDDKVSTDAYDLLTQIQGRRLCNCGRYECERRMCECEKAPIDKCDAKE